MSLIDYLSGILTGVGVASLVIPRIYSQMTGTMLARAERASKRYERDIEKAKTDYAEFKAQVKAGYEKISAETKADYQSLKSDLVAQVTTLEDIYRARADEQKREMAAWHAARVETDAAYRVKQVKLDAEYRAVDALKQKTEEAEKKSKAAESAFSHAKKVLMSDSPEALVRTYRTIERQQAELGFSWEEIRRLESLVEKVVQPSEN